MAKFDVRKSGNYVTPSGIQVGLLSLLGRHQALITNQSDKKRLTGFEELLFDCIEFIGEKTKAELTKADISRLLEPDRKAILFQLRQLSNGDDRKFIFDYEFPTEDGKKLKERKVVDFTDQNFPVKPFYWTRERMISDYIEKHEITHELSVTETEKALAGDFPIMFDNYREITEKYFNQEFVLPECGVKVNWNLLTAEESAKFQGVLTEESVNSHTQILMHTPKYVDEELSVGRDKPVVQPVPLDKLTLKDIEALRHEIMSKEASVDSTIVVQYRNDTRKQQQLDLVSMPAFFFPSLAI